MECPDCGESLEHDDTFGNIDHCLKRIGYSNEWGSPSNPIKAGDIYTCETCDCHWYTFDSDGILHRGYPC